MRGTIYLAGGGSPEDERPLWTSMLRDNVNVLYWPFALSGSALEGAEAWLQESLHANWPTAQLTTWLRLDGHHPRELFDFDLLFIGGGNTFDLLRHIASYGFLEPVRDFVAAGGSYYGGSAGAILASTTIDVAHVFDENLTDLRELDSLGLVPDVVLLPHYSSDLEALARAWSERSGLPVVGIPERSGVVIKHDGAARAVGTAPVSVVTPAETLFVRSGDSLIEPAFQHAGPHVQSTTDGSNSAK